MAALETGRPFFWLWWFFHKILKIYLNSLIINMLQIGKFQV